MKVGDLINVYDDDGRQWLGHPSKNELHAQFRAGVAFHIGRHRRVAVIRIKSLKEKQA